MGKTSRTWSTQGDAVKVKVIGFDDRGKVKLSMRVVDQATGEDISDKVGAKGGARPRDGRRGLRRGNDTKGAPVSVPPFMVY